MRSLVLDSSDTCNYLESCPETNSKQYRPTVYHPSLLCLWVGVHVVTCHACLLHILCFYVFMCCSWCSALRRYAARQLVSSLQGTKIVQIGCGLQHTVALTAWVLTVARLHGYIRRSFCLIPSLLSMPYTPAFWGIAILWHGGWHWWCWVVVTLALMVYYYTINIILVYWCVPCCSACSLFIHWYVHYDNTMRSMYSALRLAPPLHEIHLCVCCVYVLLCY